MVSMIDRFRNSILSTAEISFGFIFFSNSVKVESKTDLNPSGYNLMHASLEQSTAYDQRIIEFFKNDLTGEK